ncbi:MAG: IS1 family transposase [Chthoniobacteraceae bacterium]
MQTLSVAKRAAILRCLIEGNSVLATSRITGAAKNTIIDLLAKAGEACATYQRANLRALPCSVIQLDEIWSFVGCKEKQKKSAVNQHPGDVWTWTSVCADTKLIIGWRVGDRSSRTAWDFCRDLSTRFSGTVQITSDGHPAYKMAIGAHFDLNRTHYAQLIKIYGKDEDGNDVVIRTERQPVFGTPDIDLVSTSYVERQNLTIRMSNRRFTRLTNAFSKKLENHGHMLAVSFMHYNFCRKHTTIKTTPAQAANVADHQWTLEEVVEMIDAHFAAKLDAEFEAAFAANITPARKGPKTWTPTPKDQIPTPWYLKSFESGTDGSNH